MGHNLQVLASKKIHKRSDLAPAWFQTERAEEIHLHYRNLRIILGLRDYTEFCKGIKMSWEEYERLGKKPLGQPFDLLHRLRTLPAEAEFDADLFQVELQDPQFEGDMIHFHYRNFRFHFTKEEFEEFALLTYEALRNLYPNKYGNRENPKPSG